MTLRALVIPALRRWRLAQAKEMLALGVAKDESDHIVSDPAGEGLSPSALRRAFGQFCAEHGFDISFHGLRHSATIIMLQAGLDVRTVADRLGHSSPELIFSTYSHWITSADRTAAEKVGAVLTAG